ncbi:response regulator transcription factor [Prolixibacteraceae bacterium JC049]|nr:response regulator transcription factor [Prolixibacteraceae bacterium JC049]
MEKIKCIIIDDEPIAVDYLKEYVVQMPQLQLIDTFNRAAQAFELINSGQVDLIFLDIQMPGLTGLDFIRTLQYKPAVILTTAYSEYALEGYELNVVDYLLKPIGFERFAQAVLKVNTRNSVGEKNTEIVAKDFMFLKSGYKSVKVKFSEITHIEGMKEYVVFYTTEGKKFIKYDRMKNVEEQLGMYGFIRVHKSFLVAVKHIETIYGNTIEIGEHSIPVGRVYKEELKKMLED